MSQTCARAPLPQQTEAFDHVRGKVYGLRLDERAFDAIVRDIAAGRWPDIHIAAFLAACAGHRLDVAEMVALTRARVSAGEQLSWGRAGRRQALRGRATGPHPSSSRSLRQWRRTCATCARIGPPWKARPSRPGCSRGRSRARWTGAQLVTCNSVLHPSNRIDLLPALARAVLDLTGRA